jgi:N-acetyl-anhydromuramyl-L-alanine amidase AmpD
MASTETTPTISNGKLVSPKVVDKVTAKIEKGALATVSALIVHQTGGSNAASSLASYEAGKAGAHFLIDKDGTIYQTARVNQKCWHVGNIRSRCYEMKTCDAAELKTVEGILFKKGEAYSVRIKKLSEHEATKSLPDRYPTNEDSIGIEIVGAFLAKSKAYETVTHAQNQSLAWLVGVLQSALGLAADHVYTHPEVSYKEKTEASTAQWK